MLCIHHSIDVQIEERQCSSFIQLCYLKISTINIFGKLELYIGSATTMLFVILLVWFLKEHAFFRSHELMKPTN